MVSIVLRAMLGFAGGAAFGFAVYRFIGCRTGACPLTSHPLVAMIVWGLMGLLIASGVRPAR